MAKEPKKNAFEEKFGEGTAFDLGYGKLLIIGLYIYIAVQVSWWKKRIEFWTFYFFQLR